jgi:hypothetical protein
LTAVIVFPSLGEPLVKKIVRGNDPSGPAVARLALKVRYPFQALPGRGTLPVR